MMNKNLILALAAVIIITTINIKNALGKEKYTFLKNIYISFGIAKSFPQSITNSYTYNGQGHYYTKQRLKNSTIYRAAIGKSVNNFRAEFEFLYSNKHRFHNFHEMMIGTNDYKFYTSHKTYFINAYYDFNSFHNIIKPYIGAGMGVSQNTISDKVHTLYGEDISVWQRTSTTHFAYNTILGILVEINKMFYADFCYKFMNLGKLESNPRASAANSSISSNTLPPVKGTFKTNVLLLSFRIKF